jgi:MinD-like ATPase involved in chromosome partitioning or flagellar assembly
VSRAAAAGVSVPATLLEVERAQHEAILRQVVSGRDALVVGPRSVAAPAAVTEAAASCRQATLAEVVDGDAAGDATAILVLDAPAGSELDALSALLRERCAAGAAAAVATTPAVSALLQPLLPGATAVRQHAAGVAWTAVDGSGPEEQEVALPAAAPPRAVLLVLGVEVSADGPAVAAPAESAWVAELVAANAALRRANARLAVDVRSRESAAAAALQARADQLAETLEQERAEHAERLETEMEVARRNDALFQDARRILGQRDAEIAGLRATLARPRHRAAESIMWRLRRLPGGGLLARVLGAFGRRA